MITAEQEWMARVVVDGAPDFTPDQIADLRLVFAPKQASQPKRQRPVKAPERRAA